MENIKEILPHHEQQTLCTTRLPYRQGRKLTAVKAYTVTRESNHLLIFGVPTLNLRQELKTLFIKFGRLLQFNISLEHPAEAFTDTYHVQYDKIQPARLAKRMLDTKNFYGGSLHICYAPEFESKEETYQKLLQRQKDVLFRLKNLQTDPVKEEIKEVIVPEKPLKLNMAEENTIYFGNVAKRTKTHNIYKKLKSSSSGYCNYESHNNDNLVPVDTNETLANNKDTPVNEIVNKPLIKNPIYPSKFKEKDVEIVDCTSVDQETITNINEHLNYNKFGNEDIRKVPVKALNKIKFNINKS